MKQLFILSFYMINRKFFDTVFRCDSKDLFDL